MEFVPSNLNKYDSIFKDFSTVQCSIINSKTKGILQIFITYSMFTQNIKTPTLAELKGHIRSGFRGKQAL